MKYNKPHITSKKKWFFKRIYSKMFVERKRKPEFLLLKGNSKPKHAFESR